MERNQIQMLLDILVNYLWEGLWIIIFLTSIFAFFSIRRKIPSHLFKNKEPANNEEKEIKKNHHYLFFASMAGAVGLGNIFVVIDAVQKAGPGVIFWLWIGAGLGRYLKFWELFFSLENAAMVNGEKFTGGMVYIHKAFNGKFGKILTMIFTVLLLLYSIELYQFSSLVKVTVTTIMHYIPQIALSHSTFLQFCCGFLFLFMLFILGEGKKFLDSVTILMKIFLIGYFSLFAFLVIKNIALIPDIFKEIFYSIFSFKQGFNGKLNAIVAGISTAIYSGDIAIGYEGVMQKYAKVTPEGLPAYCKKIIQSNIIDVSVCTASALIAIIHCKSRGLAYNFASSMEIISQVFASIPMGKFIFAILIFCAAFTTVATYLQAGNITLNYVKKVYNFSWLGNRFNFFAFPVLIGSIYYPLDMLKNIMLLSAGFLILINCLTIFRLINIRKRG
jgi:AGCS family alanine or glycine:cation symporter